MTEITIVEFELPKHEKECKLEIKSYIDVKKQILVFVTDFSICYCNGEIIENDL